MSWPAVADFALVGVIIVALFYGNKWRRERKFKRRRKKFDLAIKDYEAHIRETMRQAEERKRNPGGDEDGDGI
jgi:hypothetical protein